MKPRFIWYWLLSFGNQPVITPQISHMRYHWGASTSCLRIPNAPGDWNVEDWP